jgi:ribonuclease PH
VVFDPFGYAASSVLYRCGDTVVYVGVSLVAGVPQFLRGKGIGWLTAEYEMLPISTRKRSSRESTQSQRNARSQEISRLIGRVFRTVFDVSKIGESTIHIDCDVLQADGGTRTAAISAVSLALQVACKKWHAEGYTTEFTVPEMIAGISVGIKNDVVLVDLDQDEDNTADADFNFVMTRSGGIIEIQGTSEKKPVPGDVFEHFHAAGRQGIKDVFAALDETLKNAKKSKDPIFVAAEPSVNDLPTTFGVMPKQAKAPAKPVDNKKPPMFSLANRLATKS